MFDVGLIQWLQSFSTPILDAFFTVLTDLGSHYVYMAIIPFVYWAVDRRIGRQLGGVFLASMWLNGLVKEYLTLPRPDPELVRVMVDEPSPGFPSGHAQGAITLWGYLALAFRRRWLTWLAVALIVLIPMSRLYLGVHFPADIVGGLAIGALLVLGSLWLTRIRSESRLSMRWRMLWTFLIPLLLYPLYQTGTSEQIIGFFIGFFTADMLTGHIVPFRERVSLGKQIGRLAIGYIGFAVLIALHIMFLPVGLPSVLGYSFIGIWIALGAPALFRAFGLSGESSAPRADATVRNITQHYVVTALVVLVLVAGSAVYIKQAVPVVTPVSIMESDRVLVIAHRGASGHAPENTLVSFETALEHGADILEMDVRRTRDGEVVVIHDRTVDRTTDGSGPVSQLNLAELQSLDAGYRFTPDGGRTYPWRGQGVVIPTLEQVLKAFPTTTLLIELKEANDEIVDATLAVIDREGARGRVMLASFHDAVVQRVRELAPDIPTSYGQREAQRLVILQRLGLAAFAKPVAQSLQLPEWQGPLRVANPGLARLARRQGMQLHVWTINDEEAMHRLIALGANGIMTDYPDRLQRVLAIMEGRDMQQVFY